MRKLIFLFFLLSFSTVSLASPVNIDSLVKLLPFQKEDTSKVILLNRISRSYARHAVSNYKKAIEYADKALVLAQKIHYKRGLAEGHWNLGYGQSYDTYFNDKVVDYSEGLKNYFIAEKLFTELGDKRFLTRICFSIADNYDYESRSDKAIEYFMKAAGFAEVCSMDTFLIESRLRLAQIYVTMKENEKALAFYQSCLDRSVAIKDTTHTIDALGGISNIKRISKDFESALRAENEALKLALLQSDPEITIGVYQDLGNIYFDQNNLNQALNDFQYAYEHYLPYNDRKVIAEVLASIAEVYLKQNKPDQALDHFKRSFELGLILGLPETIARAEEGMSETYEKMGNFRLALDFYKKASVINDSINDFKKSQEITRNEVMFKYEKKEAIDKALDEKKEAMSAQELKQQKIIRNALVSGLILLLFLAFFILRGYNQKKKANEIISRQKQEVEHQKEITEEKNREIIASINYAKLIQTAMLPESAYFESRFKECFVFFKPKAIVSGDFYWMQEKNEFIYFAVADCTGHGVPGGFMSMLGSSLMNEIILEHDSIEPSLLLGLLRDKIILTLKQKGNIGENQDGMDIVVCRIDVNLKSLRYAAANNPLLLIRKGELIEYPCDKQPVGISIGELKSFNQQSIELERGDSIYIFSDGFADQFGGIEGKKFKSKPFKKLIQSVSPLHMTEQKKFIHRTFDEWKGKFEQIDDVCIVGIRV